ncbi:MULTISPECIES: TetR/AcrR family transcriptional regulator [Ramlibacter]|uniref:TetR/AcrR family transcriptional regulator n=1 Tax=Ramlibacter aquaticus TaxID=2780094 RepID=A0ABR9SHD2_9BURK|nr:MULTISPECIES: TetR/AcrR family transcriptional regulator [Ramlibacter]MBE7941733.1 TetR/AcrR family transcriptional regulator [Ramlibacter aquaticus]
MCPIAKLVEAHKRERRKEARPGELLDAALELFVEKGFAATRAEEVAAHAGVSKGTLFLYFPSKEELFKAVVRENISGRFREWNEAFETFTGDSAAMLHYCLDTWWARVGSTPASGIIKLIISEARNFPDLARFYHEEVEVPGRQLIRRVLQRGVDRGEFRIPDIDHAVFALIAPMMFLIMMKHSLGACSPDSFSVDPQSYIRAQVDLLLSGLCVRKDAA